MTGVLRGRLTDFIGCAPYGGEVTDPSRYSAAARTGPSSSRSRTDRSLSRRTRSRSRDSARNAPTVSGPNRLVTTASCATMIGLIASMRPRAFVDRKISTRRRSRASGRAVHHGVRHEAVDHLCQGRRLHEGELREVAHRAAIPFVEQRQDTPLLGRKARRGDHRFHLRVALPGDLGDEIGELVGN